MSNILRRQDRGSLESMIFVCLSLLRSVSFYEITLIYHLLILVEYSFFCHIWTKPVLKGAILYCLIFLEVLSFNSHKNSLKGKFFWYLTSPKIYAWYASYLVLEILPKVLTTDQVADSRKSNIQNEVRQEWAKRDSK